MDLEAVGWGGGIYRLVVSFSSGCFEARNAFALNRQSHALSYDNCVPAPLELN